MWQHWGGKPILKMKSVFWSESMLISEFGSCKQGTMGGVNEAKDKMQNKERTAQQSKKVFIWILSVLSVCRNALKLFCNWNNLPVAKLCIYRWKISSLSVLHF